MASILDRYGIKEVADVTFYKLDKNGQPAYPVLYLDTLKVSTIEQTADESTANGGKGNVALISWDYNKDINVTIEDALFSAKSMAIMFGNGDVDKIKTTTNGNHLIMKTEQFTFTGVTGVTVNQIATADAGWNPKFEGPGDKVYTKINAKFFDEDGKNVDSFTKNAKYFCSYDLAVDGSVIRISADSFPGTYYVVGDTWARPQAGGDDEFFQFIIPKAKVLSENTITLEADGDPSVFNMNLHVLRPESGDMMMLVKYDLINGEEDDGDTTLKLYHNHILNKQNTEDTVEITENGNSTDSDDTRVGSRNYAGSDAIDPDSVKFTLVVGNTTTIEVVAKDASKTLSTEKTWFEGPVVEGKEVKSGAVTVAKDVTYYGYSTANVTESTTDFAGIYMLVNGKAVKATKETYNADATYIQA